MTTKMETGQTGEDLAQAFLLKKGYTILATNWTYGHKEIDIIAEYEKWLVIVEVKCRNFNPIDLPQNAVNRQKQKDLISATNAYVSQNSIDKDVRFDIVTVILKVSSFEIDHIEDAFYPVLGRS